MKQKFIYSFSGILLFICSYTAVNKYLNRQIFRQELYNQPFSNQLADILLWAIPIIESMIALLLLFSVTRVWGLRLALFLLSSYSLYTILVLSHVFNRIPCSCGGFIMGLNWQAQLGVDLALLCLTVLALYAEKNISCMKQAKPKT
jgi:putative oxidoreductase